MPSITLTLTNPQASRVTAALGKAWNLKGTQDPPVARDATQAEVKQYLVDHLKRLVNDIEGGELLAIALAASVPPPLDVT